MELWGGEEVVGEELEAFDAVAEEVTIRESGNEAREVIRDGRVSWRWGFWWGTRERGETEVIRVGVQTLSMSVSL